MTSNVFEIFDAERLENFAKILDGYPGYRVLRALDVVATAETPRNMFDDVSLLVLDVETTGLNHETSKIIEFAARLIVLDYTGAIIHIGAPIVFLEDPGEPLSAEIVALTGLTDADLRGERIDDAAVLHIFETAPFVIAHNAAFDRPFVEKRFPGLPHRPWLCSCHGIDWRAAGFEGKSLHALLMQLGLFQPGAAHRASSDVDALVALLMAKLQGERTVADVLIENAKKPTMLFEATGSHISTKDVLSARGYRWNVSRKVWSREVPLECRQQEEDWLDVNVYAPCLNAKASGPTIHEVTALQRYSVCPEAASP
jgi:DNA polymerase-3 subunit epsilon